VQANQPEGLELLDVAQCCYKLTTKKLCVELQPLRVGDGATASDAPHHCGRRRLAHQPAYFVCQDVAGAQRPSPNLLKLKALMSNKKTEENNVK